MREASMPCALVGAALPPAEEGGAPFAIKLGKLRGGEPGHAVLGARAQTPTTTAALILADDAPSARHPAP